MDKYEELTKKYELITSNEWLKIREIQLNHIVSLANSAVDPLVIQGMLKNISDTDKWKSDFLAEKQRLDKAKKE